MNEAAPAPNVRLRTNVVCLRIFGPDHRTLVMDRWVSSAEVHDQLFYWDLLELSRRFFNTIPTSRAREGMLTPRQLAERHAFLREGFRGGELWRARAGDYRPITPPRPERPFFERPQPTATDDVVEPAEEAPTPVTSPVEVTPATVARPVEEPAVAPLLEPPATAPPSPLVPEVEVAPPAPVAETDIEQDAVIEAPISAKMLVLAPPGSGKTYTLIRRVRHLVETGQAEGQHAITVLSFTRAAVSEIVSRITSVVTEGAADNVRYVTVRTFDSFTSQLLRLDLAPEDMPSGYEARIQRLERGLKKHELPNAAAEIGKIKCLMVDEVQDLVGDRANLVLALVKRVAWNEGGVVLLGDFAQAIYDYQVEDEPRQKSSADFLDYVRNYFSDGDLTHHELKNNHRVTSETMRRFVSQARSAMGEHGTMPDGQRLGELLHQLGEPETLTSIQAPTNGKRVAVLTRSNLQAFHFAEWCRNRSLPCVTVQGATSSFCPGWVGRLSHGWCSRMMSKGDAAKRWEGLIGSAPGITFDEAFARLEKARVVINGQIDMAVLSRAVIEQRQELTSQDTSSTGLYVSTVHRSKGLEFDEVFLFDPSKKRATWQGKPEEVRVVYVAATRAKSKLSLLRVDSKALGMSDRQRKTPVKQHPHEFNAETNTNRIFLDGLAELDTDSLLEDLPGAPGETLSTRIAARQNALWDHYVNGGRKLNAIRDGGKLTFVAQPEGDTIPICNASLPVTSDFFGLGMWFRSLQLTALCGTPMLSLATVAYQADDDEATEILGPGRLLMAPVLRGWGTVVG